MVRNFGFHLVYLITHCPIANSTGVYSGVVASGNGNSNDETNIVCLPTHFHTLVHSN